MKPQNCISKPGEAGDCYRACLASIIEMPIAEVPNFNEISVRRGLDGKEGALDMARQARDFLAPLGLSIFNTYCDGEWSLEKVAEYFSGHSPGMPVIVHGMPRFSSDEAHAVVLMDGKLVHDPSGAGIAGPCKCSCDDPECRQTWWFLDVVGVAANWAERKAA